MKEKKIDGRKKTEYYIKICQNPDCKKEYSPDKNHRVRQKYCSRKCAMVMQSERMRKFPIKNSGKYLHKKGSENGNWKGGKIVNNDGYICIYCPNHLYCCKEKKYVLEHRLIMESHIGRVLLPTEVVHHINGIRTDNRIENLMLFSCTGEHSKLNYQLRKIKNKLVKENVK